MEKNFSRSKGSCHTYLTLFKFKDLLVKDPKKRLTLKEVMDHKWLKSDNLNIINEERSDSSKFKNYASLNP
jgi:serine/threonine protein kinase